MESMVPKTVSFYYQNQDAAIMLGDAFQILRKIKKESIDMIFADPPYF